jgi:hypothetical protein
MDLRAGLDAVAMKTPASAGNRIAVVVTFLKYTAVRKTKVLREAGS